VHDAARPLLEPGLVHRVVERLMVGDVDGVVPTVPIRDTLKVVRDGRVVETTDRSDVTAAQTPQGFRLAVLQRAHLEIGSDVTDDAAMVEAMGGSLATVDGDPGNLKVTYPADLALAEALRSITDD
jgi:2-C-methyl-D-erythritol 4-phosphate cytidylyltransferase